MKRPDNLRIALVLGSGAARGWAHIGVIRELEDGRLCSLRLSGVTFERQIGLCWHHEKPFSRLTTAFISFIQTSAKAHSEPVIDQESPPSPNDEVLEFRPAV